MFSSSRNRSHSVYQSSRVHKSFNKKQPSFRSQKEKSFTQADIQAHSSPPTSPSLHSAIVTISVGPTGRLFAAHEEILNHSPWFAEILRRQYFTHTPNSPTHSNSNSKRIDLPDQQAEVFSSVLEYLYKGDYYPRLEYNKRRNTWTLENGDAGGEVAVVQNGVGGVVLKDTVIYCTAELYGLSELKRLALKKQGLQQGIQCSTILTSARFAYENTPDTDSRLRAHYLALVIRSRDVFKRSGTMQTEMERGGRMWFDLFVALVNHLDDVAGMRTPM